ncbi:MAG: hypothetical protein CMJ19_21240 [Phycisphaeraceae bacterium]|nr:hypothetical protein [Phycisphaeraceae bacterium]
MSTRQWIIRTLLATLAIAAIGGAIGILFGGDKLTWQIIGSAVTVSMGCLFYQISSGLSRVDNFHRTGLLGMGLTGIEFLLCLLLIWFVDADFFENDFWEVCGYMSLTLPITGLLAMLALYLQRKEGVKLAGHILLAVSCITQLLLLLAAINDSFRLRSTLGSYSDWWETSWALLGYGLLAVLILAGRFRPHKLVGLIATLTSYLFLLIEIWIGGGKDPTWFALATIISILYAHGNVIWLLTMKGGGQAITRMVVQGMAVATGLFVQLAAMDIFSKGSVDGLARLSGACAFMTICGTFALLVIHGANRRRTQRRTREESELVYRELSLTCPHCQTQQTLPIGESHCRVCHMAFQIKLFEPHCPQCDYLLINAASDTCPECGYVVRVSAK